MRKINKDIILTDEQKYIIDSIERWYNNPRSPQVYQLSGSAGTGKSLVLHRAIERLKLKEHEVAPMAFTGAATIIMRLNGFENAKTLHASIYKLVKNPYGSGYDFEFNGLPDNKKLIVLDEASMVDMAKRKDLESTGIKILAAGDINQLPPVKSYGGPAFFSNPKEVFYLTKIMRQNSNSAIIQVADMLKNGKVPDYGVYNEGELAVITKKQFTDNLPMFINTYGIVLCGLNETRDKLNKYIRENIKGYTSPFPVEGEPLVCKKNNWNLELNGIHLVNGLFGVSETTVDITDFYKDGYFLMDFTPNYLNTTFESVKVDYKYFTADMKTKEFMKSNFFHRHFDYFDYAYASTVHSAQGSQYDTGIYIEESIRKVSNTRLNYTAITRFRNKCIYVR